MKSGKFRWLIGHTNFLPENWSSFVDEALERYERGVYDFIFFTQIYPGNPHHLRVRCVQAFFLGYPGKITVPPPTLSRLTAEEVERVTTLPSNIACTISNRLFSSNVPQERPNSHHA